MTKAWQIYFNAIFGAIGGMLAWLLIGQIETGSWEVTTANLIVGALIGLFIGIFLGSVDGIIIKKSARRTLVGLLIGGFAGIFGGMLGLLLGGMAFTSIGGGLIARMIGWLAFGLFLGLGLSVLSFNIKRAIFAMIGGAIAGLIGGTLYELFTQTFIDQSGDIQVFLSVLGLILIGMSLGIIIPVTVEIAREGVILVLNGRRKGWEVSVLGDTTLGSSDASDVYVPDENVERKQAVVNKTQSGFAISNVGQSSHFLVNQNIVVPGNQITLPNKAVITMGETKIQFQAR